MLDLSSLCLLRVCLRLGQRRLSQVIALFPLAWRSLADSAPPVFGSFSFDKEGRLCSKSERRRSETWPRPSAVTHQTASRRRATCRTSGVCAMKKLFLILIAGFALVMALDFNGAYAGDHDGDHGHDRDGGIPLSKLAGKYAAIFLQRDSSRNASSPASPPPSLVPRPVLYLYRMISRQWAKKRRTRRETLVKVLRALSRFLDNTTSLQPSLCSSLLKKSPTMILRPGPAIQAPPTTWEASV